MHRISLRKYTNSLKMNSHLVEFNHVIHLNKIQIKIKLKPQLNDIPVFISD